MSWNTLNASIRIDATPDAVLSTFQAIERWSMWYPGVVDAGWISGKPWKPGAVMQVQVRNSLGMLVKSRAVVLPAENGRNGPMLCWENRAPGLVTVCYAWVEATADGSRFTLQKRYRGVAVPLLWLMKGRQERMVQEALVNLQEHLCIGNTGQFLRALP